MRYYNACMYNKRDKLVHGSVITVDDGVITDIGVDECYVPEDGDYDCQGTVVHTPFMDSAVLIPGKALFSYCGLDLSRYNEYSMYVYAIRGYQGDTLRAFGYNTFVIGDRGTVELKQLLDKCFPDKPAYILSDDVTTAVVNECILEMAKEYFTVSREMHEDGELDAYQLAILRESSDIFNFSANELVQGLLSFQYDMLSNGITAVRILDSIGGIHVIDAIRDLCDAGTWLLTAVVNVPIYPFEKEEDMWNKYNTYLDMSSDKIFVTGVTLTLDGSVDSAQAALTQPYAPYASWNGDVLWSSRKLGRVVQRFIEAGVDVNIRAYGDKAVSMAVFVFSGIQRNYEYGKKIITHAYLMLDEDISMCRDAGIYVCQELNSIPRDNEFYEGDWRMLGERCYEEYPFGKLCSEGVQVIAGSNYPTQPDIYPLYGVFKAANRGLRDDTTEWRALQTYSYTPYKLFNLYHLMGSVDIGKSADFVLLDKDLLQMRKSRLMDTNVIATVVDGKVVFKKD